MPTCFQHLVPRLDGVTPKHSPSGLLSQLHEERFLSLNFYPLASAYSKNQIVSIWSKGPVTGPAVTAPFGNHDWLKKEPQSITN